MGFLQTLFTFKNFLSSCELRLSGHPWESRSRHTLRGRSALLSLLEEASSSSSGWHLKASSVARSVQTLGRTKPGQRRRRKKKELWLLFSTNKQHLFSPLHFALNLALTLSGNTVCIRRLRTCRASSCAGATAPATPWTWTRGSSAAAVARSPLPDGTFEPASVTTSVFKQRSGACQ